MSNPVMKTKYTENEVGAMRALAAELNLMAPDIFWTMKIADLAVIANGCGPDSWPEWMREQAGKFADFPLATLIHDVEFHFSNGNKKDWAFATWAYGENAKTETNYRYPFKWSWARFMKRMELGSHREIAVKALELGSWEGWVECSKRGAPRQGEAQTPRQGEALPGAAQ